MFGLSFGELFVIGIVALIVIGPERLPKVARTAGFFLGRAQRYLNDVKSDIQREMDMQEITKLKDDVSSSLNAVKQTVEQEKKVLMDPLNKFKSETQDLEQQLKQSLGLLPTLPESKGSNLEETSVPEQTSESASSNASTSEPEQSSLVDSSLPQSNPAEQRKK